MHLVTMAARLSRFISGWLFSIDIQHSARVREDCGEHLTEREVEKLIEAANRHGQRDSHKNPDGLQAWLVGFGIMRASME
jgi:hypothetical protein